MKTLDLVLKAKWYDMIDSGVKTAEYREVKPYWCKRLKGLARNCRYSLPASEVGKRMCQMSGLICDSGTTQKYDKVRFRRGYTNNSMTFLIESIELGYGNPEWGAPENEYVFIINLGERINNNKTI